MDPKGQNTDAHLNSLLSLIHSDPIMPSSQRLREKFKLDAPVSDGGSNFSGGEKQLCKSLEVFLGGGEGAYMRCSGIDESFGSRYKDPLTRRSHFVCRW